MKLASVDVRVLQLSDFKAFISFKAVQIGNRPNRREESSYLIFELAMVLIS